MGSFFIPKKQKRAMRDRRKRKRMADRGEFELPEPKKKPAVSVVPQPSTPTDTEMNSNAPSSSILNIHRSNSIKIPAHIQGDPKQVKKFRKDARRQARAEGRDETKLVFVDSQTKRKNFPCIKDLLQQEKKETQEKKTSPKATEEDIPDSLKKKYVALDCEMVGIGSKGQQSVLARASMVDWWGKVLLDAYVKCPVTITDFRTKYSGIRPQHLQNAMEPAVCRQKVADLLTNRILVGHALHNDLSVLMLQHSTVRDTATYRPFQRLAANGKWRPRKLRDLVKENCDGMVIQEGSHDSVQDATATIELFKTVFTEWESEREAAEEKKLKKQKR